MSVLLEMNQVEKSFGATRALDGISLSVRAGTVHALVGENGAGKSTLMKVLSGAHVADAGSMRLEGEPYHPRNPLHARASGISMIYQELSLAPHLTITENIFLGVETGTRGWLKLKEMRRKAVAVMERAGLNGVSPETLIRDLSMAQCQQVEVARALASGCRVLVLDEPTSSLTKTDVDLLFERIREWRSAGIGIVYISHFLEEVEEIADDCTVICDGRVVKSAPMSAWTRERMIDAMVGRDVGELYPASNRSVGETVLTWTGPETSIELKRGEVLGIAGLIGSGRTEFLQSLFALRPVLDGDVTVKGVSGLDTPAESWSRGMGFLSEDRKREGLALTRTITENITLSKLPCWSKPSTRDALAKLWVDPLSIKCAHVSSRVESLSGGNQQKVALARLLHHDADVWLLDEPTRGVDVGAKSRIYQVLNQWTEGKPGRPPCAVIVVSSYLPELLGICDRIAVMNRGQLRSIRPRSDWTEHTLMKEAVE